MTKQVVGVAFAGRDDAEGHGYIIPVSVLQNFIAVFEATGDFTVLPSLGIDVQELTNPYMRLHAFRKKPGHHYGILITHLLPFSCAKDAGVQVGDILMAIDGKMVTEEGKVAFRGQEFVHYSHAYTSKRIGDTVRLTLIRELKSLEIDVVLKARGTLVPREIRKQNCPDYVIIGGLVLVVASWPLVFQSDPEGYWSPIPKGVEEAEDLAKECDDPEFRVVIVSCCLAHELNVGYGSFQGCLLESVNGKAVRNLANTAELIKHAISIAVPFVTLAFRKKKRTAVFQTAALLAATPMILDEYKVPKWTSLPFEVDSLDRSPGWTRTVLTDSMF